MGRIVEAINEEHPEVDLTLDSFHSRGNPHAVFTVLHKTNVDDALNAVTADYERRLELMQGQKDQLMQVIAMLGAGNLQAAQGQDSHGNQVNIHIGANANVKQLTVGDSNTNTMQTEGTTS